LKCPECGTEMEVVDEMTIGEAMEGEFIFRILLQCPKCKTVRVKIKGGC